ncbi:hypothetical protein EV2_002937 [Malus domestica]
MRLRKGKPKISSWEKMKTRLQEKFLPLDFTQYSFSQFNNLHQETKSVVEYTEEFYKLSTRNDIQETKEQFTSRYVGGLRPWIHDKVKMYRVWRVNDAYQLALKAEARLAHTSTRRAANFHSFYPSSKGESSRGGITNGKAKFEDKGHVKSTPTNHGAAAGSHRNNTNNSSSCFKCGQTGHQYKSCPKQQVDTRVGFGCEDHKAEYFDVSVQLNFDEDNDVEHEEIEPEIGESLVIHQVFSTPKSKSNEDWLRSSIFKTRCKSHGKVCTLVIDGGSCENIVSQDMIDKLKLQTEPHPQPY